MRISDWSSDVCSSDLLRKGSLRCRGSFDGAMQTARVIQNVVDATADGLATITAINAILGLIVSLLLWALGRPSPFMWGGIVAICNFVPYLGPIVAAILLALGGLMTFDAVGFALLPAMIFVGVHLVEANLITPLVLGRSEEHTSELQSLMRRSYAVFCL